MPTILSRIKQKVRDGNFVISGHCQDELENDFLSVSNAVKAILNASEFDKLTDDESHVRYVLYGEARDGRALDVIVMIHQGTVILKTAYESDS
jgi:hypothetical protein